MSTYVPVATQTVGTAVSSVIFSSLPQNYTDLIVVVSASSTSSSDYGLRFTLNDDTASNYSVTALRGNGSSADSYRASSQSMGYLANDISASSSGIFTPFIINLNNYSSGAVYKTVLNRAGSSNTDMGAWVNLWRSFNPITSLKFFCNSGNIASGSTFTIYGVAAGNSSAKASGGNIVTTDGSYWYHAFTTSGTFVPSQSISCDYVVVAGGGGGGTYYYGGGGGAGGYRSASSQSLSANTVYQAIVGAGGFGGTSNTAAPTSGNDSTFVITSAGGGRGGSEPTAFSRVGIAGGSGGGGDGVATSQAGGAGNTPSTSPSQGNAGGTGVTDNASYGVGGGGGGATAAGANASGSVAGVGGAGSNVISTWLSSLGLGASGYLAGGGGGGAGGTSNSNGAGGSGGGGAGGANASGVAGLANTGGGGGGSGGGSGNGGRGGSGVVIIRYAV